MINKKMWVRFDDDLEVVCFCDDGRKKCTKEEKPVCEEYVVKFIPIERSKAEVKAKENADKLAATLKKFKTELDRNAKKFKQFKI